MADSLEYRTIFECFGSLVTAFKGDPVAIADELAAVSLIPPPQDVADQKKSDLARRLAEDIRDRVKLSPSRYEDVVRVLSKHKWLEDIVRILQNTNEKLKQKVDQQNTLTCDSGCDQHHGAKSLLSYPIHRSFSCDLDDIPYQNSSFNVPNPIVQYNDLDEDDKEDLLAQMYELTKQIDLEFEKLLNNVLKSFTVSEDVNRDSLVLTLVKKEGVFKEEELARAKTIFDVLKTIKPYCSYFNYDIIEVLVEVHGSDLTKSYFKEYIQAFAEYCKAMPCAEEICGSEDTTLRRSKLHFKLDFDRQLKPDAVRTIKSKIARHLGIRPSALYLCRIKDGCIELEFLIPDFILQSVFPLRDEQKIALYQEVKTLAIKVIIDAFHMDNATEVRSLLSAKESLPVTLKEHQTSRPLCMLLPLDTTPLSRSIRSGRSKSESEIFHPFISARIQEKDQRIAELEAQLDDEQNKRLVLETSVLDLEEQLKQCDGRDSYDWKPEPDTQRLGIVHRDTVELALKHKQPCKIHNCYCYKIREIMESKTALSALSSRQSTFSSSKSNSRISSLDSTDSGFDRSRRLSEEFSHNNIPRSTDNNTGLDHNSIQIRSDHISRPEIHLSNCNENDRNPCDSNYKTSSIESNTDSDHYNMQTGCDRSLSPMKQSIKHNENPTHLHPHCHHPLHVRKQARLNHRLSKSLSDLTPVTEVPEAPEKIPVRDVTKLGATYDIDDSQCILEKKDECFDYTLYSREISRSADNINDPHFYRNHFLFTPSTSKEGRLPVDESPTKQYRGKEKTSCDESDHSI